MSSSSREYLLTSSDAIQPSSTSACLIDFNSHSGNILQTYKGGGIATINTLTQIGNDYVLGAEQNKPLLHAWPVNSEQQAKNTKLILPGPATALSISPNNIYLAVAIESKLYIWYLPTGNLLSIQQKHILPITCVKFSDGNGFLVSTCQAGMLIAYRFGDLISVNNYHLTQTEIGQVEPMYIHKHHTDAIIGLHVGSFENDARVVTVSNDRTIRLYNLITGSLLLQLIDVEIGPSIIFDMACWNLFLGTNSGDIFQFSLISPPRSLTSHPDVEGKDKISFKGHQKRVTCLDLNLSCQLLVSGSEDGFVIVWEVYSRQQLNRIEHKGGITNVKFILSNKNIFAQNFTPTCKISNLKRNIDQHSHECEVAVLDNEDYDNEKDLYPFEGAEMEKLHKHLYDTKAINHQLYFALLDLFEKKES